MNFHDSTCRKPARVSSEGGWSSTAHIEGQLEYVLKSAGARLSSALGIPAMAHGRKSKRADFASLEVALTTTNATTECCKKHSTLWFGVSIQVFWLAVVL